jgi:DNA-binding MurR/RpiR family transcriptional regulator
MNVPQSYEGLRQAIVDAYPTLSRQLQRIGRHAIDHPQDVAMHTVAALAKRIGVQPSSLVRFAQALGLPGFSEVQQVFRTQLLQQFSSMQERVETLGHVHDGGPRDAGALLRRNAREAVDALGRLERSVEGPVLEAAVARLQRAGQVLVLGQGRAFPVAYYLAFALARLERRSVLLSGVGGMQLHRQQAELATPADALIAVSFRPYTALVIELAASLKARGVPVIAITDSRLSPLAPEAHVLLEVQEDSEPMFLSLVAPLCLAQTLMVALGQRLAQGAATVAAGARAARPARQGRQGQQGRQGHRPRR